jgi:hypothetical protein
MYLFSATALHRYASVSVNGAVGEVVKQRTTDVGVVVSVPLQVTFKQGTKNNVTISGVAGRRKLQIRVHTWLWLTLWISAESGWLDRVIVY